MKNSWFPALTAFIVLIVGMEFASAFEWVNPALLPPPSKVLQALREHREDFQRAFFETSFATLCGFLASAILGFVLAVSFSLFSWLRRAILPFAIFFQTVPIIAVAPLLVIYFGFGLGTVTVSSLIVSIFPVLANTLLGLQSTDSGTLELMKVYDASTWQTLWKVRLPEAYSSIYAGLKIAAGLSVIGTVAGEFVAGGGLGAMIDSARTQQRIDLVFGALLLLSILGLALIQFLKITHKILNSYRPYGLHMKEDA